MLFRSTQLQSHVEANNLYEPFQSGFRPLHSTETALLRVTNDLLCVADSGALSMLILLDLSSASYTTSHNLLLSRMRSIGITGSALFWLSI